MNELFSSPVGDSLSDAEINCIWNSEVGPDESVYIRAVQELSEGCLPDEASFVTSALNRLPSWLE